MPHKVLLFITLDVSRLESLPVNTGITNTPSLIHLKGSQNLQSLQKQLLRHVLFLQLALTKMVLKNTSKISLVSNGDTRRENW